MQYQAYFAAGPQARVKVDLLLLNRSLAGNARKHCFPISNLKDRKASCYLEELEAITVRVDIANNGPVTLNRGMDSA